MKLGKLSQLLGALAVATTFGLLSVNKLSATTSTVKILGLSPNNILVRLDSGKSTQVKGIDGNLQGIDFRPANGKLYGVTDTDKIYVINPDTGAATFVKTLNTSFDGGFQSGFDFNPVPDRLRIVGSNDQNFRTNVDTGSDSQLNAIHPCPPRPPCLPCLQPESVYLIQVRTAISLFNHSLRSIF